MKLGISLFFSFWLATSSAQDPEIQNLSWKVQQGPNYAPFTLWVQAGVENEEKYIQDVEKAYGPALSALAKVWKTDWADPLQIQLKDPKETIPIVLFASYDSYKSYVEKKIPGGAKIPPSYINADKSIITYHTGLDFESKMARRQAVLRAAAEQIVDRHILQGTDKKDAAWVRLGMAAYLSEIREKPGGGKGPVFVREETPDWKQDFPKMAETLLQQGNSIPSFKEILDFPSIAEIEKKAISPESAALYIDYMRLCSYSILIYFRSKPGDRFIQPFVNFLKDDFQGQGSLKQFETRMSTNFPAIEKEWEEFCEWKRNTAAPAGSYSEAKVKFQAGKMSKLPLPAPLDLSPKSLVEFRAEIIERLRNRQYESALLLFSEARIAESKTLQPLLSDELVLLEPGTGLYKTFAKQWKAGDKSPSGFGLLGEFTQVNEDGFELREKTGNVKHKWTELDIRAVGNYLIYTLKYADSKTVLDVACMLLCSGETAKAKKLIQQASEKDGKSERSEKLLKLIPDFEVATKEANAREELKKFSKLDPVTSIDLLRKLLVKPELQNTQTLLRAKPFLMGFAAQAFDKQNNKFILESLFKGKVTAQNDGSLQIQYKFQNPRELEDWSGYYHGTLGEYWRIGQDKFKADWKIQNGVLILTPNGTFFHNAWWSGDISLEAEFQIANEVGADSKGFSGMMLSICDDFTGNVIANSGLDDIVRFVIKGNDRHAQEKPMVKWVFAKNYQLQLSRTGDKVQLFSSGEEKAHLEEKELKGGKVAVSSFSQIHTEVSSITIKGQLDPEWQQDAKLSWIQRELKTLFGTPQTPEKK